MSERNPFWKRVIGGKYEQEEEGWCTKEVREGYCVGVWKTIRGGWEALKDRRGFRVGFDNRVKFWIDKCCGDTPLRELFLALYAIASLKDAWVVDI